MTVRYRGHHCTQLRLGVFNPIGRDGSPPTLIRVVPRTERERECDESGTCIEEECDTEIWCSKEIRPIKPLMNRPYGTIEL